MQKRQCGPSCRGVQRNRALTDRESNCSGGRIELKWARYRNRMSHTPTRQIRQVSGRTGIRTVEYIAQGKRSHRFTQVAVLTQAKKCYSHGEARSCKRTDQWAEGENKDIRTAQRHRTLPESRSALLSLGHWQFFSDLAHETNTGRSGTELQCSSSSVCVRVISRSVARLSSEYLCPIADSLLCRVESPS